ncbi:MAG TPA: hypothetical protein VFB22_01940 [Candidatus Baltobacteraceae bacterium]|nr:hypothetical protein [Candidatus Baltobacteraceae bacterium]
MVVLDASGKALDLKKKLGEGGEGAVWASPERSDRAVKTYLRPISTEKSEKLATMVGIADPPLLQIAAWPSGLVYDATRKPVGFEMPKLGTQRALHEIFGTKSRMQIFPEADWRLLVHAAVNVAGAFEFMHRRAIVIGDVNPNNVVIQNDAQIRFIDCDSFQITVGSRTFRCEVGMAEYQPPELQGVALGSVTRTAQHDAFGMAVLIFQLLFLGKHPFMGRLPNPGANPPTIDQNIKLGNYFYDERARQRGLEPPPASLTLAAVTPELARLFERAFRGAPDDRPLAHEWKPALQRLEASVVQCSVNKAHRYRQGINCPWCTIEVQQQIVYFAAPSLMAGGLVDESIWATFPQAEVDRLWAEIAKVAPPNIAYAATPASFPDGKPIDADLRVKGKQFLLCMCGLAVVAIALAALPRTRVYDWVDLAVALIVWLLRPRGGAELMARRVRFNETKTAYEQAEDEWRRCAEAQGYATMRQQLAQVKTLLSAQRATYEAEIRRVRETGEAEAKKHYLDSQFIRAAKIKGIGPALTARLAYWNIETALDITDAVYRVQGIGPAKAAALKTWRSQVEQRFRFDRKMIEPMLLDVKRRHVRQRLQGRTELLTGPQMLRGVVDAQEKRAYAARATALQTRALFDQARADMRKMSPLVYR